jgi:uroporphyrinogen decarboxylase
LKPRERVLKTINLKEPDRIPICMGGAAQKFAPIIYEKIKERIGISEKLKVEDKLDEFANIIYYHPKVLEYFGVDYRYIQINRLSQKYNPQDETWENELGYKTRDSGRSKIRSVVYRPLKEASIDEIKKYKWPDPYDKKRIVGLKEEAKRLYEETDYAIASYKATAGGIFDMGAILMRGMDVFLIDLIYNKRLANVLLDKIFEFNYGIFECLLREIGDYLHVVEFNDDLGTQDNLMISPELYREFIKPRHKLLIEMFRKYAPNAKIFFHSDGSIYKIIPDLIDIGVDILNPVQPLAKDMDSDILKKEFGKDLCFQGGIDLQRAMIGSTKDVELEVKKRINFFAPGGGYVLSSSNNIMSDVPLDNVFKLYESAKKYGKYPINI